MTRMGGALAFPGARRPTMSGRERRPRSRNAMTDFRGVRPPDFRRRRVGYPADLAASTWDCTRAVAATTAMVHSAIPPIAQKMSIGSAWSRIHP